MIYFYCMHGYLSLGKSGEKIEMSGALETNGPIETPDEYKEVANSLDKRFRDEIVKANNGQFKIVSNILITQLNRL